MPEVTMLVSARTDVGRARDHNEDAYTVTDLDSGIRLETGAEACRCNVRDRGVLMAVAHGMGGHQAGEVASALVLDSLRAAFRQGEDAPSIEKLLETAVQRANRDVAEAARAGDRKGMGATLTCVFVKGAEAYVAEVGDSRAYLLRGDRLRQITRDQSLVQMLVDSGVISPEEARESPQKSVILQGVGLKPDVRVAIARLELRRGDRLLICCDGLSNMVTDQELQALLAEGDPKTTADRMIDLANERGGEDNITAIVAHFDGPGLPLPSPDATLTQTLKVIQEYDPAAPVPRSPPPPPPAPIPRRGRSGVVVAVAAIVALVLVAWLLR
jgi:serine/threonine protein phosphatase PrpC